MYAALRFLFPKGEFLLRTLPEGPIGRVAIITFTYWFQSFTTPTTHEKNPFIVRSPRAVSVVRVVRVVTSEGADRVVMVVRSEECI